MQQVFIDFDDGIVDRLVDSNKEILFGKFVGDGNVPMDVLVSGHKECIKAKLKKKTGQYAFFEDDVNHNSGLVVVERAYWDSKHFGVGMGKFVAVLFDPPLSLGQRASLFVQAAQKSRCSMLSARINMADLRSIQALESQGGFLTDLLLTFRFDLEEAPHVQSSMGADVVKAVEGDSEGLVRIGKSVFFADRFHSDPHLSKPIVDEYHGKWVLNSLQGLADVVLAARKNDRVVGFITCKVQRARERGKADDCKYGVIDLIGVDRAYQGQGIGTVLVCSALEWFSERVGSVYVGTQAANSRAVKLYERCGFGHVSSEATLHWWL